MAQNLAPVRVLSASQLKFAHLQRVTKEVSGRMVTILLHNGNVYALDAACFHMGGPLGSSGDIEELGNHTVISCPWHHRKVDLRTGQQVDTDLQGQICPSQHQMQRVYRTALDAEGWIWLDLSSAAEGAMPSDKYNCPGAQQTSQYGYGLGHRRPGSGEQAAEACAPLTPFAGIERRALTPSPAHDMPQPMEASSQQLPYRAQKSASMRNANARMAVLRKLKQPQTAPSITAPPDRAPTQRTIQEMFSRHQQASSTAMEA